MAWSLVLLQFLQDYQNAIFISVFYILTWFYIIRGKSTFLIDDDQGIARFDDVFCQDKDKDGKIIREWVRDSYEHEEDTGVKDKDGKPVIKKTTFKNRQLNPLVGFPECYTRWIRLVIGAKFSEIGTNLKGHKIYGYLQSPTKHHLISFILFYLGTLATYFFLAKVFGPKLAFFTTILFLVHPLSAQAVAWISSVGYLFSLLCIMVILNASVYFGSGALVKVIVGIFTFLANTGVLVGVGSFITLWHLGFPVLALISFIVSLYCLKQLGYRYVQGRIKAFKEQEMHKPARFDLRKPIVMVKTIWYYLKLMPFPKRLGLYHSYMYHFDEFADRINKDFWFGILSIGLIAGFYVFFPFPVQFGILWFFSYIAVFSNFVTAQQVVAERYVFIPNLGFCLIACYFLQYFPIIFAFLVGIALMKTWSYLPAFNDQISFYRDNALQFDGFEVPVGNLGVAYANKGKSGMAFDTWHECAQANPEYDVPHYNIWNFYKKSGQLEEGRAHLKKAVDSKMCHFPKMWADELKDLDKVIERKKIHDLLMQRFNDAVSRNDFNQVAIVKAELDQFMAEEHKRMNPPKAVASS